MLATEVTETNLNEYGRFDELKNSVDKAKAKRFFELQEERKILPFKVNMKVHNLLKDFIINSKYNL